MNPPSYYDGPLERLRWNYGDSAVERASELVREIGPAAAASAAAREHSCYPYTRRQLDPLFDLPPLRF